MFKRFSRMENVIILFKSVCIDNSLRRSHYLLRASSAWQLCSTRCLILVPSPSWPIGNMIFIPSCWLINVLKEWNWRPWFFAGDFSDSLLPPNMLQAARCWASCCCRSCWWLETCPASRGTLDTAHMSVSATGLSVCLYGCNICLLACLFWHDIGFCSTYCDEYDPVEAVDGQILHYVSDRVFKWRQKIPSQMDVAPWCYKWVGGWVDRMDIRVGWGIEHLSVLIPCLIPLKMTANLSRRADA